MHLLNRLIQQGKAHPPKWLPNNLMYLTQMGSFAYGCNEDDSDLDLYGFCIPPKEEVFPHLAGEIPGFGSQLQRFDQYQESHMWDQDARGGKGIEVDMSIYSIVRYFHLVMGGNPNMVDSLFTDRTCVIHSTKISEKVRENRKLFLSKKCWHTFKGYAYSQMRKMDIKDPEPGSKRDQLRGKYGYDVKFAMHLIRLVDECEQILTAGDIDLRRNREQLKDVRKGGWSQDKVRGWFELKEKQLERLYYESDVVPYSPPEEKIKALLMECLEEHYGSLSKVIRVEDKHIKALRKIQSILEEVA